MSNIIRSAAEIEAEIAQLNANAEAGQPAPGGKLTLLESELRIAKLAEKFYAKSAAVEASAKLDALASGDSVRFNFGRGEKARVLEGKINAVTTSDAGVKTLSVLIGEPGSPDLQVVRIPAVAVLF